MHGRIESALPMELYRLVLGLESVFPRVQRRYADLCTLHSYPIPLQPTNLNPRRSQNRYSDKHNWAISLRGPRSENMVLWSRRVRRARRDMYMGRSPEGSVCNSHGKSHYGSHDGESGGV